MSQSPEIKQGLGLANFTSWQVGGDAEFYCAPQSHDELKAAMMWARKNQHSITVLGGGSNVLISDQGIKGLVIHTHRLNKVRVVAEDDFFVVEADAGAQKSEVLKFFLKHRLAPAVFLAGLPGDMAGGVVMNAGVGHKVHPREFCEIVQDFDVLTFDPNGEIEQRTFTKEEILWDYRKSRNWQPGIISRVRVAWPMDPSDETLKEVREGNKRRKGTQPLSEPSCGSVFKNPEGDHAGRLVESVGLKGFSIGGAQVSEKHANFIVNRGGASATDIDSVIKHVQATIHEKKGVWLTNEVVYLGEWTN